MIGTINGLKQVGVVNPLPIVPGKQRASRHRGRQRYRGKGNRSRCDRGHHLCCSRLDLVFFQNHGREATSVGCPGDLANGEREAFRHDSGSGDDNHLVRMESYTHTPYVMHHRR